jgi:hypothetical protein
MSGDLSLKFEDVECLMCESNLGLSETKLVCSAFELLGRTRDR